MWRMSRTERAARWPIAMAVAVFIGMELVCGFFVVLNHRLSRELVSHSWREPMIFVSAAHARPVQVSALYGVDWRVTPPVSLASLPPYVPNAFLAAEDVRFRHHPGIDPIGMARALVADLRARAIAQGGSTIDQQIV